MPETFTDVVLVGPQAGMFDAWFALYERYATERGAAPGRRAAGILWRWLLDGTYRIAGVLAQDTHKELVGFAHFRPYPNTLDGSEACRIDDIYVTPAFRGSHLTERLIEHVCKTARKRSWTDVTWTADDALDLAGVYANLPSVERTTVPTYRVSVDGIA